MIRRLDHIVLTVQHMEETIRFYTNVLGMKEENFGEGRKALRFGLQRSTFMKWVMNLNQKLLIPSLDLLTCVLSPI